MSFILISAHVVLFHSSVPSCRLCPKAKIGSLAHISAYAGHEFSLFVWNFSPCGAKNPHHKHKVPCCRRLRKQEKSGVSIMLRHAWPKQSKNDRPCRAAAAARPAG